MKKLLSLMAMFLMVAVAALPSTALATPTLWLSDGIAAPVIVVDQGPLDKDLLDVGVVAYIGSLGSWNINVTTGMTMPAQGSASNPSMDLNSLDKRSVLTGQGTLTLMFSEVGYTLSGSPGAIMTIGGTIMPVIASGGVTYKAYFNNSNVLFDTTGVAIGTLGPYLTKAFAGDVTNFITTGNPYSLTQFVKIELPSPGTVSLNVTLDLVPLPPSALFLGTGLLGLVALGWRRRQAS